MSPRRLLVAALLLAAAAIVPSTAAAASTLRSCGAPHADRTIVALKAKHIGCRRARLIARRVSSTRRNPTLYRRRRCEGDFCVRAGGLRCRPTRSARKRERCRSRGRVVTWTWR